MWNIVKCGYLSAQQRIFPAQRRLIIRPAASSRPYFIFIVLGAKLWTIALCDYLSAKRRFQPSGGRLFYPNKINLAKIPVHIQSDHWFPRYNSVWLFNSGYLSTQRRFPPSGCCFILIQSIWPNVQSYKISAQSDHWFPRYSSVRLFYPPSGGYCRPAVAFYPPSGFLLPISLIQPNVIVLVAKLWTISKCGYLSAQRLFPPSCGSFILVKSIGPKSQFTYKFSAQSDYWFPRYSPK